MFQQNHVFAPEKIVAGEGYEARYIHSNESGSLEPVSEGGHHLVLEYKIGGPLTYVTASAHCKRFLDLAVDRVLINLSHVTRIDHDGIAALEELIATLEASKKHAYICGLHRSIQQVIEHAQFYQWMIDEKRVLRSYKKDTSSFLVHEGPTTLMSEAQCNLQQYLSFKMEMQATDTRVSFDNEEQQEAVQPLLGVANHHD
mmetsp:Transcript_60029/g.125561  ORF Transcript_60029/g.125561 Transcript_60029/m.125561 type:complete len:200 (-) Transcript_60029:140-739(-)